MFGNKYWRQQRFESLSDEQLGILTAQAHVLEQDIHGPKVYLLNNGKILKLFRIKRWWSGARFDPYSIRFWRNSAKLSKLDIPTVKVESLYQLSERQLTAVLYEPLPGTTLRETSLSSASGALLIQQLGSFVAKLHALGIYFRSLHLGNIVLTPAGEMGLIDIADLKVHKKSLSNFQRLRNLRHLCRLKKDRLRLGEAEWQVFCRAYFAASASSTKFSHAGCEKIKHLINAV